MNDVGRSAGWIAGVMMMLVGVLGVVPARGQQLVDPGILAQEHVYARPNYPTIRVFVLGDVGSTGIWRVEPSIQFIELLAVSNAGNLDATLEGDTRDETMVNVYRHTVGRRELIYSKELTDLLLDDPASYPVLQDGDIVFAQTREKRLVTVGSVIRVAAQAAALILLGFRLSDALRGTRGP